MTPFSSLVLTVSDGMALWKVLQQLTGAVLVVCDRATCLQIHFCSQGMERFLVPCSEPQLEKEAFMRRSEPYRQQAPT